MGTEVHVLEAQLLRRVCTMRVPDYYNGDHHNKSLPYPMK